jgi:hypothetical protein
MSRCHAVIEKKNVPLHFLKGGFAFHPGFWRFKIAECCGSDRLDKCIEWDFPRLRSHITLSTQTLGPSSARICVNDSAGLKWNGCICVPELYRKR